jgi:hypothetical protein
MVPTEANVDETLYLDDYDEDQLAALLRAARMAEHLRTGGLIQPLMTSLRLNPDETPYLDENLVFSRYYSEVAYEERPWSYLSPTAVVGSAFRNWAARTEAEARWRNQQFVRAVLTDQRTLVAIEGQWVSFEHKAAIEYLPEPAQFRFTVAYEGTMPLRLSGMASAEFGVALAVMLNGVESLDSTPEFEVLHAVVSEFG